MNKPNNQNAGFNYGELMTKVFLGTLAALLGIAVFHGMLVVFSPKPATPYPQEPPYMGRDR